MSKTNKLIASLQQGQKISIPQAMSRFGFSSPGSVRKTISNIRNVKGIAVFTNTAQTRNGPQTRYCIGTAPRAVVAAGYRSLASNATE